MRVFCYVPTPTARTRNGCFSLDKCPAIPKGTVLSPGLKPEAGGGALSPAPKPANPQKNWD